MSNNIISNNNEQLNFSVSYGKKVYSTLKQKSFLDILRQIQTGNEIIDTINKIRSTPEKKERDKIKEQKLPVFSMAKYLQSERKNVNLESIQHLLFDFDHLAADRLSEIRRQMQNDPTTLAVFLSPSGDGLKLICPLDEVVVDHKAYTAVYIHHAESLCNKYGIPYDPTKDAARVCYVSYDPDIYINPDALPLQVQILGKNKTNTKKKEKYLATLDGVDIGQRTHALTQQIGAFIKRGMPIETTLAAVMALNKQNNTEPLSDEKVESTVRDMYNRYSLDDKVACYWSYGTDILEIGVIDNKFYMEKNLEKKVYVRLGAFDDAQKAQVYNHLVTQKHIAHLSRINFLGNVATAESYYEYLADKAMINVHYAPIDNCIQDNQFIENYLEQMFGKYKNFIKEWLAVYTYTNYRKLPFLVLTGDRACGKNTFAEAIAEIFPTLSTMWHGIEKNFNPEVEMKLLIADETVSNDEDQYKTLKKYSGQKDTVVNHKYLKPYKVPNNMNIIILSNAKTPIFVERDEYPACEENNQFFVFNVTPFSGPIDTEIGQKLVDRLGHYVRTELKVVYNNLNMIGNRYSIKTPITPEERALFANNVTQEEMLADEIVQTIKDIYAEGKRRDFNRFINSGYIPTSDIYIDEFTQKVKKLDVLKKLVDRGVLQTCEPIRKQKGRERTKVYVLTDTFKSSFVKPVVVPKVAQVASMWQLNLPLDATGTSYRTIS